MLPSDVVAADGNVCDSDRLMYLRNGMMWQQRATAEGIPLKGRVYWSAMDNLEWTDGFDTRFAFKTQKRMPMLSADDDTLELAGFLEYCCVISR